MTKTQVEVITSVQRRRRWSRAEKERIVAAAIEPGTVASEVARAAGIHVSQLFRWRQQLRGAAAAAPMFSPPDPPACLISGVMSRDRPTSELFSRAGSHAPVRGFNAPVSARHCLLAEGAPNSGQ